MRAARLDFASTCKKLSAFAENHPYKKNGIR